VDNKPYTRAFVFGKTAAKLFAVGVLSGGLALVLAPVAATFAAVEGAVLAINGIRGVSAVVAVGSTIAAGGGIIMSVPEFKEAFEKAKLTGKLIGLAIALGLIFPNQTISLIGFTLGAETVKNVMHTLHICGAHKIIHEIVMIGGLTTFKTKEH
jgi:hypothetical protein